jgi:hypothetical protein
VSERHEERVIVGNEGEEATIFTGRVFCKVSFFYPISKLFGHYLLNLREYAKLDIADWEQTCIERLPGE